MTESVSVWPEGGGIYVFEQEGTPIGLMLEEMHRRIASWRGTAAVPRRQRKQDYLSSPRGNDEGLSPLI